MIDNDDQFRLLMDEANRANASFYPIDPRGLAVFDSQIGDSQVGPGRVPSLQADLAVLRGKQVSLRRLAHQTDGLAVVSTNNIVGSLQRVVDDLSSYYLLGYSATGVEMDGKFHNVTVRVSRPGVEVRARRGYLAASREESLAAVPDVDPGGGLSPTEIARARAIERAVGSLASLSREMPLRVQVAAGWATADAATVQVVGEFGRDDEWAEGAQVDVTLTTPDDETLSNRGVLVEAGTRRFDVVLTGRRSLDAWRLHGSGSGAWPGRGKPPDERCRQDLAAGRTGWRRGTLLPSRSVDGQSRGRHRGPPLSTSGTHADRSPRPGRCGALCDTTGPDRSGARRTGRGWGARCRGRHVVGDGGGCARAARRWRLCDRDIGCGPIRRVHRDAADLDRVSRRAVSPPHPTSACSCTSRYTSLHDSARGAETSLLELFPKQIV